MTHILKRILHRHFFDLKFAAANEYIADVCQIDLIFKNIEKGEVSIQQHQQTYFKHFKKEIHSRA